MPRLIENIDAVAFDLDGTLVDSAPDLSAAVNTMLGQLHYAPLPEQRVREMIGGGVERLVESALHESTGRTPEAKTMGAALRVFEGLYAERLFDCGRVFPGVMEGLRALRGWNISVLRHQQTQQVRASAAPCGGTRALLCIHTVR